MEPPHESSLHYSLAVRLRGAGLPAPEQSEASAMPTDRDTSVSATGTHPSFLIRGTLIKYLKTTLARYLDPAIPIDGLEST
jgi:hypothetical protein